MQKGSTKPKPALRLAVIAFELVLLGLTGYGTVLAASWLFVDLTIKDSVWHVQSQLFVTLVLAGVTAVVGRALLDDLLTLAKRPWAKVQKTPLLGSAIAAPDSDAHPDVEVDGQMRPWSVQMNPFIDRSELESIRARPGRVEIWAGELARGMVPPVCVRSGRPAETALRYRFVSKSDGLLGTFMANRVSGLMPLTRAQRRLVLVIRRAEALGLAGGVMVPAGIVLAFTNWLPVVGVLLIAFGSLFFVAEVLWRFTGELLMGPKGEVLKASGGREHIVALRRVHPVFAAAMRAMRAAAIGLD